MIAEGDSPFNPIPQTGGGGGGENGFSVTGMELILMAPKKNHELVVSDIDNAILSLPEPEEFTSDITKGLNSNQFQNIDSFNPVFEAYRNLYKTTINIKNQYNELSKEFDQSEENRSQFSSLIEYNEKTFTITESQALVLSNQVNTLETQNQIYTETNNLLLARTQRLEDENNLLQSQITDAELNYQVKVEEIAHLIALENEKIALTDAESSEKLKAQDSQLIQYNSINQDLSNQVDQTGRELQVRNKQVAISEKQVLELNQRLSLAQSEKQRLLENIIQQKQQDVLLKQQWLALKNQIQAEFNERITKLQEENSIIIAQLREKTEEKAIILREKEEQTSLVVLNQQRGQQIEVFNNDLQQKVQTIQQEALAKEQNSALMIQNLKADIEYLQLTLTTTTSQNQSLIQQLDTERNTQLVDIGSDEENQQNQLIIAQQNIQLETIKAASERYAEELRKEQEAKKRAEKSLLELEGKSKKMIITLQSESENLKQENKKITIAAKLNAQSIQSELEIQKSAKQVSDNKAKEFKEKAEQEGKELLLIKTTIENKDKSLLSITREKQKLEKALEITKATLALKETTTTIPQAALIREKQEKELLTLKVQDLENQLHTQNQQLIIAQQPETDVSLIEKESEKSKLALQSTKGELDSLKLKTLSLEKAQKGLVDALKKINISTLSLNGIITEENSSFSANQENNKSLLRLSPEVKTIIETSIKQHKSIHNLLLYNGKEFKAWVEASVPLNSLNLIPNKILNQLIVASNQGIISLPPSGGGGVITIKKPHTSTKPKSGGGGSGGGGSKVPIGTLILYDSSLHPMYHLEMILQQNMFNLAASPSVSSDNTFYTMEVKFQTGIEANPIDQLCFIAKNVTLQEAPEGGRHAYIVSLGKDKKIEYTNIGLLSTDCIFQTGLFSLKIINNADNSLVKEEELRYVIEPQVNQPPYNTRAAVDISKDIKFYLRALGKGTYFLEMIVVYQ